MSRDQDVKVAGRIIEQTSLPDVNGRGATWCVEVPAQEGEHHTGRKDHVTARVVTARMALKMHESGVRLRPGDMVDLLVNPWTVDERVNGHVCCMIRRHATTHTGTSGMPQRPRRAGTHWR